MWCPSLSLHTEIYAWKSHVTSVEWMMPWTSVRRALQFAVYCRYYSATIIKMSGVEDTSKAIWLASLTAFVNFVFTFVGLFLVDRIGRRPLTIGSLTGENQEIQFGLCCFYSEIAGVENTSMGYSHLMEYLTTLHITLGLYTDFFRD